MGQGTCSVEGCGRAGQLRRGMCDPCYRRWMRANPQAPRRIAARGSWIGATCTVEACEEPVDCRGMCDRHYNRWLKSGATADPIKLVVARCTVAKCPGSVVGWGYCATHYANWRHTGDPLAAPVAWRTRFFMKVDRRSDDECWPWLGAINATTGYGYFNQEGQTRLAHGVAYEIGIGPVPDGLQLDHQCRNRPCVNWHHLMPVTAHENILRSNGASAQYARRTHCSHGHPFTPENTHWAADGRRCLTCAASKLEAHVRQ